MTRKFVPCINNPETEEIYSALKTFLLFVALKVSNCVLMIQSGLPSAKLYIPSFFSLSSYCKCLRAGTILVACR